MKSKIHILCPEHVPLENKGEEAIIQGVIDTIFRDCQFEYHIVDNNSNKYYYKNGFHCHPGSLFFSKWRSNRFNFGLSWDQLYSSFCSLTRNGLNLLSPKLISKPHKKAINLKLYISGKKNTPHRYKQSIAKLKQVNYIIAGHNGGLNDQVCHILNELHKVNIQYGIFGSSMSPGLNKKALLKIYRKTFTFSQFNIARNPIGYKWATSNFPDLNFELKHDPAFGMIPISSDEIKQLLTKLNLASFFEKPVIMFTTAEPEPIRKYSFDDYSASSNKINAHRAFLADFIKMIYCEFDVNLLFLPHTIGPSAELDDRKISKDIIQRANLEYNSRVKLLEEDLTAKELKGLIGKASFLVAERVHSIIGAIGVETPFMCLASNHDVRVKGIIKMQLNLAEKIYYLNNPILSEAFEKFKILFEGRNNDKSAYQILNKSIHTELKEIGAILGEKIHTNIQNFSNDYRI